MGKLEEVVKLMGRVQPNKDLSDEEVGLDPRLPEGADRQGPRRRGAARGGARQVMAARASGYQLPQSSGLVTDNALVGDSSSAWKHRLMPGGRPGGIANG